MNLNEMFKDASLNNLQWLRDGITVVPNSKDNDTKDDLELQWNYGDLGEDYSASPEAEKMPTPCDSTGEIVQKAREFLNQGLATNQIWTVMLQSYTPEEVTVAKKAWADQKMSNLDGIVGKIALDVRGYSDLKDALRHASKSPFKKFIKYVVGYKGDNVLKIAMNTKDFIAEAESCGNATDDFLASETKTANKKTFVKELMMPVLAHSFDLDDSEADSTLIELSGANHITEADIKDLKANHKTAYSRIRAAFQLIDQKKQKKASSDYKGKVNIAEHVILKADNEIEFEGEAMPAIQVDDVALPTSEDVNFPVNDLGEVEVEKDCGMIANVSAAKKKSLAFEIKKASLDINVAKEKEASLEVDGGVFHEAEFEGIDGVDVDDVKKSEAPLDIDGRGDFSF